MKHFLSKILPRIKQFSDSLDRKEIFVEQPWTIIDEDKNKQTYIFKRDGNLIISNNGNVSLGTWEYIPAAKSLLIVRVTDKLLLNQGFIDPAIMILRKDGLNDECLILANPNLLPDLDIENYLRKIYYERNDITCIPTEDGNEIELHDSKYGFYIGKKVSINGDPISDKIIRLKTNGVELIIKKGIVRGAFLRKAYDTKKGKIFIDERCWDGQNSIPAKGNKVYDAAGNPVPDGKYWLSCFKKVRVRGGTIV